MSVIATLTPPAASPPPAAVSPVPGVGAGRGVLPLIALVTPPDPTDRWYGIAVVDSRGQVTETALFRALGWGPGRAVDITVVDRAVLVWAAAEAAHRITARAGLLIPAPLRHRCGITAGDRVLLTASPRTGVLTIHPTRWLDHTLAGTHPLLGGDQ